MFITMMMTRTSRKFYAPDDGSGSSAIDDMIDEQISTNGDELPHASEVDNASTAQKDTSKTVVEKDGAPGTQSTAGNGKAGEAGATDGAGKPGQDGKTTASDLAGAKPLVDPDTGEVIAEGGAARRVFEREAAIKVNRYEKQIIPQMQRDIQSRDAQIEAYKSANVSISKLNLTPEQVATGASIMAQLKADPVKTVKELLTQVQGLGYDVTEVQNGGLSAQAVQQMLQNALAPFVADRTQTVEQSRALSEAKTYVDNFLATNPGSETHVDVLHNMIAQGQANDLETAYLKLQLYCAQNQLDISKPLRDQVIARRGGVSPNNGATPPAPQVDDKPSLPIGRGNSDAMDTMSIAKEKTSGEELSNKDIVKNAMRASGYNV